MHGPFDQHQLILLTDAAFPRCTFLLRFRNDFWIDDGLELPVLPMCVPIPPKAHQKESMQVAHLWS